MLWNVPILLTWLRILIIPIFTALFYLPARWVAHPEWINYGTAILFAAAAVTDWFDGYLARKWNQTSNFGAFLDPVADKLMVAVALILLVATERTYALFAIIIIGREITISALREWMAQMGKRSSVAVAKIGKFKTAAQMVAILLLLLAPAHSHTINFFRIAGNVLMLAAAILTVWSMCYYLKMATKEFQQEKHERA